MSEPCRFPCGLYRAKLFAAAGRKTDLPLLLSSAGLRDKNLVYRSSLGIKVRNFVTVVAADAVGFAAEPQVFRRLWA